MNKSDEIYLSIKQKSQLDKYKNTNTENINSIKSNLQESTKEKPNIEKGYCNII